MTGIVPHKYTVQELKDLPLSTWVWINFRRPQDAWELKAAKGVYIKKSGPQLSEERYFNCSWPGYAVPMPYKSYDSEWDAWNINPDTACVECDDEPEA